MKSPPSSEFEQLAPHDQHVVDWLCDEFEQAIQSGQNVRIEDYLARIEGEAARRTAVNQLVGLEVYHGRRDSGSTSIDGYETRFPDFGHAVTAAIHETATLFAPNSDVGPFRIERQLGEGGMGVVYLARDRRLEREVALKVLPFANAQNEAWLKRFHREAKILAGLTHPHIATLYGFEEQDGLHVCVMEYVPGRTLADRLAQEGQLPLEDVRRIFEQVAVALEFAHSRGVVHRDLKPANILITPDGDAKLLDFGLASHVDAAAGPPADGLSEVEALRMAGTVPYMSPEQLRGRTIDKRADIWAFGCCLYEVLTARRAFQRDSPAEAVSAILDSDVDWEILPPETSPATRFLLKRCLQKEPKQRLRDLGDAWVDDVQVDELIRSSRADAGRGRSLRLKPVLTWIVPWILVAAMAAWAFRPMPDEPEAPTLFTTVNLPEAMPVALAEWAFLSDGRPSIALTPDGRQLVYVANVGDVPRLCVCRMDRQPEESEIRVLEGTDGAYNPFVSPDGEWVGFFSGRRLKKVRLRGGQPVPLCEVWSPYGASWADDGYVYISDRSGSKLVRVSDQGGTSEPELIAHDQNVNQYIWAEALPSGKGVLVYREWQGIVWVTPDGAEEVVLPQGRHARYVKSGRQSGHLVFAERGRLMAVPFDLDAMQPQGEAVPVVDNVRTESRGCAQFATASDAGTMVYIRGGDASRGKLVQRSIDTGDEVDLGFDEAAYGTFVLSPDGAQLAVVREDATRDIWIYDLKEPKAQTRLTHEGTNNRTPVWSPDGEYVWFSSNRDGGLNIYRKRPKFTEPAERLTTSPNDQYATYWFEDQNRWWLAIKTHEGGNRMLSADSSEEYRLPVTRPTNQLSTLSRDGRWLAWGGDDVRVQRLPGPGENVQVSSGGGEEAMWMDMNRIAFRNRREWMLAEVETDPNLRLVKEPTLLFEGDYMNVPDYSYAILPDEEHFILLRGKEPAQSSRVEVATNWFDDLRQEAPATQFD